MITTEKLRPFTTPPLLDQTTGYGKEELESLGPTAKLIFKESAHIWALRDNDKVCAIYGVVQHSLVGTAPWFWFILGKAFNPFRHIKIARKLILEEAPNFPNAFTFVEVDWKKGEQFATLCGFWKTQRTVVDQVTKKTYNVYKVNEEWLSQVVSRQS